jgi:hypothetical protein
VAVLSVQVRAAHGKASQWLRLAELVHRAVPYPVLLIQTLVPSAAATPDDGRHGAGQLALSLAHKRAAQNEAGKVVLDGELVLSELLGPDAGRPHPWWARCWRPWPWTASRIKT